MKMAAEKQVDFAMYRILQGPVLWETCLGAYARRSFVETIYLYYQPPTRKNLFNFKELFAVVCSQRRYPYFDSAEDQQSISSPSQWSQG